MTQIERDLVISLAVGELSEERFLSKFRPSFEGRLTNKLLWESTDSKLAEEVECAVIVGWVFGFELIDLEPLIILASEKWHHKHEDIVTALGKLESQDAVDALYKATQWVPDYLDYDENRALAVKAIWALGGIKSPEATKALRELKASTSEILSREATKQLLGRTIED